MNTILNVINNKGETPLHWACKCYNYENDKTMIELLKLGTEVDKQDNDRNSAYTSACKSRRYNKNVQKCLIKFGVKIP
ncbi:hypothetical protein BCR36DRAFT_587138 [Piromyces finnis]|uniref:Uncharacterized protein n=1 Tax=Piromyces finnis TaxID=1754191 RepID=A0A1Y1UWM7_9FUNG|nr:hypothetical protein BCR36DRAFT_587138 [Piromyces finnis]|eukprot:ORX42568.1 hypothetical protein BCR36DRAFT_587138 [Piromyces finnis]